MMTSPNNHNKKRNTALMYEFLVKTISRSLVEGDKRSSSRALKIIKKHFKPGSELYKEFRLINSLLRTTVSSSSVASSIIQEAKTHVRGYDAAVLDKEKSLLIRSINHTLDAENFYDQQVNEYRMYATIQTLVNDWRRKDADLGRMAKYEDQLTEWLLSEKNQQTEEQMPDESPGTSRLLMKMMMKKLNEKYSGTLTELQKSLVRAYAFSTANDDERTIVSKLSEVKQHLIESIETFECSESDYIGKKLIETKQQLINENISSVDDSTVARFMLYAKLDDELNSKENEV